MNLRSIYYTLAHVPFLHQLRPSFFAKLFHLHPPPSRCFAWLIPEMASFISQASEVRCSVDESARRADTSHLVVMALALSVARAYSALHLLLVAMALA